VDTLGIDLGSVSIKVVVLSGAGEARFQAWRRTQGRPFEAAAAVLREAIDAVGGDAPIGGIVVTGSGKDLLAGPIGAEPVNEIVAHATAAWTMPNPSSTTIVMANRNPGMDSSTSMDRPTALSTIPPNQPAMAPSSEPSTAPTATAIADPANEARAP